MTNLREPLSRTEVGTIAAGQSGTTGRLENVRTCGFHDHNNESDPARRGRIIVQ